MTIEQLIIYFSNLKNKDFFDKESINLKLANEYCRKMAKIRRIKPEIIAIDWYYCWENINKKLNNDEKTN